MSSILYNDLLNKALEDLLIENNVNINDVEKSDSGSTILMPTVEPVTKNLIVKLFKKFVLGPIAKSLDSVNKSNETVLKKQYADAIILDENGRILLLKRNQGDGFEPDKWCLPGGNVESGEESLSTAKRELKEETNLDCELQHVSTHETDHALINYHFGRCELNEPVIIDSSEHCDYNWVNINELDQYDLLLDLGQQLNKIFDLGTNAHLLAIPEPEKKFGDIEELTFEKAFEMIAKSYDEGLVTDEQFFDALRKYELVKTNNLSFDEKFEKGLITEEDLFKAIKSKPVEQPEDDEEDDTDDPMDEGPGGDDDNDPAPGEDDQPESEDEDSDDTHAPTGLSMDKLKQLAMTTGQEQLENFIKHSKDPELRKIAHDELARRQDDEHVQEDDDSKGGDKSVKQSSDKKPNKKPTNAKEALDAAQAPTENTDDQSEGPDVPDIHSDPDYEDKAGQYAQAISNGEDPSTNPFLADFANHIEEKKKGFKPLDLTIEVPDADDMPNNQADDDQSNVEADDEQQPETKESPKTDKK